MAVISLARMGTTELVTDEVRIPGDIARALHNADAVLQTAAEEAERLRREGYELGLTQGREEGRRESAVLLCEAHVRLERQLKDLGPVLVETVITALSQLVVDSGAQPWMERAARSLHEALGQVEAMTLRVAPSQVAEARAAVQELVDDFDLVMSVRVEADPGCAEHECVIETPLGGARVRLAEQLQRLRESLLEDLMAEEVAA